MVPIARRQVLEISDSGHGNQRTAFLSEVKPEETFLSRDYLRAKVKHPGVSGGADRTSQKHFLCVWCSVLSPLQLPTRSSF